MLKYREILINSLLCEIIDLNKLMTLQKFQTKSVSELLTFD